MGHGCPGEAPQRYVNPLSPVFASSDSPFLILRCWCHLRRPGAYCWCSHRPRCSPMERTATSGGRARAASARACFDASSFPSLSGSFLPISLDTAHDAQATHISQPAVPFLAEDGIIISPAMFSGRHHYCIDHGRLCFHTTHRSFYCRIYRHCWSFEGYLQRSS